MNRPSKYIQNYITFIHPMVTVFKQNMLIIGQMSLIENFYLQKAALRIILGQEFLTDLS